MPRLNLENEKTFLNSLKEENYSLQEEFIYKGNKQSVLIKHNICGTVYKTRINNFIILGRRCPNKECLNNKKKQTSLKNYGVEHPCQSEEIAKKQKQTFLKNYGTEWGLQSKKVKDKSVKTNLEKYGVENPLLNEEIKNKIKQTNKERYGHESPMKNEGVKNKVIKTTLERYGVENITQLDSFKKEHPSPFLDPEVRERASSKKLKNNFFYRIQLFEEKHQIKPLFRVDEFQGVKKISYPFQCLKCLNKFEQRLDGSRSYPRCYDCEPIFKSYGEKELFELVKEHFVSENNKKFMITGKKHYELDVFVPELKLGFEFDGIKFHSEFFAGRGRNYHIDKNKFFGQQGITVYHVFENEWIDKNDIVKSIVLSKIGKTPNIHYARKLDIKEISNNEASVFYEENHIQGGTVNSLRNIALCGENGIICVLSFSKPRFNKKYDFEITRFANKKYHSVVGGFSRLFKSFLEDQNETTIITYADRRYSTGGLYRSNGFNQIGVSSPNYWYTKDYKILENRMKYQKHKLSILLEKYDNSITEQENMFNNGYDRIWDLGNLVFEYSNKN